MAKATFKAVSRKGNGGLEVINEVRNFKVILDEPVSMGGTDKGVNPVENILVSLGSCLVIVGEAFAKAKGIDLQDI
jgi:uncharacterized OsmC-like protein